MEFKTANGTRYKRYNISGVAKELGVTRQTIYYWIKKGWVEPKRDYRSYPVFTKEDLNRIKKWHNSLHETPGPVRLREKKTPSEPPPNWKWGDLQNILYK